MLCSKRHSIYDPSFDGSYMDLYIFIVTMSLQWMLQAYSKMMIINRNFYLYSPPLYILFFSTITSALILKYVLLSDNFFFNFSGSITGMNVT